MKLLIGGSPCTHWSIAQTKNREAEASGIGWDLFMNYRIACDKYQPDFFLYENNKSMSPAIRAQITAELGVEPVLINSALVSAQSRQRLYWVGKRNPDGTYSQIPIEQPEDKGLFLRDILETGVAWQEKAYTLRAKTGAGASSVIKTIKEPGKFPYNGAAEPIIVNGTESGKAQGYTVTFDDAKSPSVIAGHAHKMKVIERATNLKQMPIYEVHGGYITIKGTQYPIKLADGFYIIRKLTVRECMRLQTVPETYAFPCSPSQAYKMLGNGWTVEVIAHIMSHFGGLTAGPVEVLSMYDGMSCGHIALDKLGANVTTYYATEIDKYAIQTTQHNYPETVQLGDAFQVREEGWTV